MGSNIGKKIYNAVVTPALLVIIFYGFSGGRETIKSDNPLPQVSKTAGTSGEAAMKIVKDEVSSTAKFYPYILDGVNMEIIAVKATDGTIRTALNTCQVCYDSGRGYYVQRGEYLVCQNCGNRFHIDQIEKIKAFLVLKDGYTDTDRIKSEIMSLCREYLATWSVPREFEIREELPTTLIGKVDWLKLKDECT